MGWKLTLAIFFVVWWISFLAVLPWGVKTAEEAGEEIVPGQSHSAPVKPHFRRKILITTGVAALVTLLAWANATFGWIGFEQLPGSEDMR
jgi:predicted secreted protein